MVSQELLAARWHYWLYRGLRKSFSETPRTFNQAPAFWGLTLNAHLEATRMSLSRLYDQHDKSIALRSWLRSALENPDLLENQEKVIRGQLFSKPLGRGELESDVESVERTDPDVNRFVTVRGNAFAHRSRVSMDVSAFNERFPLHFTTYETLLERGEKLLHRYSVLHDGMAYALDTGDEDDYKLVVAACRQRFGA